MKKFILCLLAFLLIFSFSSCAKDDEAKVKPKEITGIDDDDFFPELNISSIKLDEEGKVTLITTGELKEKIGGEYVLNIKPAKDIYVLPYGNGGYRCVMTVNQDGTVTALNPTKLITDKEIVIVDDIDLSDIVSLGYTSDIDGQMIYAIDSNGDKHDVYIY